MLKRLVFALVACGMLATIAFFGGRHYERANTPAPEPIVEVQTIVKTDTITQIKPVYIKERIKDTIKVAVTEVQHHHDTTYVVLPRTSREYAGDMYRAVVSGVQPSLDEMQVFRNEVEVVKYVQTPPPPAPKFILNVQSGFGVVPNISKSPYVGVLANYNLTDRLGVYGMANITYDLGYKSFGTYFDVGISYNLICR